MRTRPGRRRDDWDKILDGVRDILFDAPEPITATAIRRALGENAPSLPGLIYRMNHDRRFQSNDEKRWLLAKEEPPEEHPKKRPGAGTSMVNPETDNGRLARWRRELGPDRDHTGTTKASGV
jgi:hypothetical protein